MHMQNFILIAGAETRRTFAKGDEKKYPGNAQLHIGFGWAVRCTDLVYIQKLAPCPYLVSISSLEVLLRPVSWRVVTLLCLPIQFSCVGG